MIAILLKKTKNTIFPSLWLWQLKEVSLYPALTLYGLNTEVRSTSSFWSPFVPHLFSLPSPPSALTRPIQFPYSSPSTPPSIAEDGSDLRSMQRSSPQNNAWASCVIWERLLFGVSSNSTALTKNFTINYPRYSSPSYKIDELISQVYNFSWRANILRPNSVHNDPRGMDRNSTSRKKPKLMKWL